MKLHLANVSPPKFGPGQQFIRAIILTRTNSIFEEGHLRYVSQKSLALQLTAARADFEKRGA